MPRYIYISPFKNWYQFDCNWSPETWELKEARANAEAKHPEAAIGVDAECMIDDLPAIAKVAVYAKDTIGKTDEEVLAMLDHQIDVYVAFRDERSPVRQIPKEYWSNYEQLTNTKVKLPPY